MRYAAVLVFLIIAILLDLSAPYFQLLSAPQEDIEDFYVRSSNNWDGINKIHVEVVKAQFKNTLSPTCANSSVHGSAVSAWRPPPSHRKLYIAPLGGLANVLQTIASSLTVAKREDFDVKLVLQFKTFKNTSWDELFLEPAINEINGTFPDGATLSETTETCNVQRGFTEWKGIQKKWKNTEGGDILCATTCCWKEGPFPHSVLWFYKSLVPAQGIQQSIQDLQKQWRWHEFQWVGVHIRRSDNLRLLKRLIHLDSSQKAHIIDDKDLLPIENYISLMEHVGKGMPKSLTGHLNLRPLKYFLATDNSDVRNQVMGSFSAGAVVEFSKDHIDDLRGSTAGLQSGVVDLSLLAACDVLIGTPYSTFSATANYIGGQLYLEPEILSVT